MIFYNIVAPLHLMCNICRLGGWDQSTNSACDDQRPKDLTGIEMFHGSIITVGVKYHANKYEYELIVFTVGAQSQVI